MRHPSTLPFLTRLYDEGTLDREIVSVLYSAAEMQTREAADLVLRVLERLHSSDAPTPVPPGSLPPDHERIMREVQRAQAVQALGLLGFEDDFERLVAWAPPPCSRDPDPSFLWALGELGGARARPLFEAYAACAGVPARAYLERALATLERDGVIGKLGERIGADSEHFAREWVRAHLDEATEPGLSPSISP
jgi:hypothetical protein